MNQADKEMNEIINALAPNDTFVIRRNADTAVWNGHSFCFDITKVKVFKTHEVALSVKNDLANTAHALGGKLSIVAKSCYDRGIITVKEKPHANT